MILSVLTTEHALTTSAKIPAECLASLVETRQNALPRHTGLFATVLWAGLEIHTLSASNVGIRFVKEHFDHIVSLSSINFR